MSRVENIRPLRQREPRRRDKAHMGYIAQLPCVACMAEGRATYGVEVAHVRSQYVEAGDQWRGAGGAEKPHDANTLPLCRHHHRTGPGAQHGANEKAWWEGYGVYPPSLCAALVESRPNVAAGIFLIHAAISGKLEAVA